MTLPKIFVKSPLKSCLVKSLTGHKSLQQAGDDHFVSILDKELKKKAREELNELNDEDRKIAVQTLRKWILEQEWLTTPTDFGFLLRFLRVRKFSQLGARDTIVNYWESRTESPSWFRDVDPADKTIQDIIESGFYLCPKQCDRHGRRTIFFRTGPLNSLFENEKMKPELLYKVIFLIHDWLIWDEPAQVHGITIVADYTDVSFHLFLKNIFTMDNAKKFFKFIKKSQPIRVKVMHIYNEPTFYDAIYAVASNFMNEKIKQRRRVHGKSYVKIYEDLGMSNIPREYLPDDYDGPSVGSVKDIAKEMIADMLRPDFRDHIIEMSSSKYGVDLKKKRESCVPVESFRQLKTD